MIDVNKEELKQAINEVLDSRRREDVLHKEHHAFLTMLIEKEKRKRERLEKIKTQVMGWAIIAFITSVLGGLGYAAVTWATELIEKIHTGPHG